MAIKQVKVGGTTHDIELLGPDRINGFLSSGKILSTYLPSYLPAANVSGTANKVAKFTATNKLGNSNITDDGSTVTIAKDLIVTGDAEVSGTLSATKVYGAVWNDYAEYRDQMETIEPGYCVASSRNGKVTKTQKQFQACEGIVSDTFGFAIGETDLNKTPLAAAGRVLAYYHGNCEDYEIGDAVCAGPEGKIMKMTREEIKEWPDRIVGIVSEFPDYETWGEDAIKVNGRIWITIK